MKRRIPLGLLIASALSLLVGLPAAAGGISKSEVQSKALSLSNMPTGWSVDNSAASGGLSSGSGCLSALAALKKPAKSVIKSEVYYTDGTLPSLQETVEAGNGAADRYAKYLKTLNHCTTLSFSAGGQKVTGTVGAMSFPPIGNSSRAYAINFDVEGQTIGLDVVFFRAGEYDGDLAYEDYSPDTSTMQAFATEAVDKIEGKAVTPPTGNT
jgi:hypothetical protein